MSYDWNMVTSGGNWVILFVILALLVGLGAGYFWGRNHEQKVISERVNRAIP